MTPIFQVLNISTLAAWLTFTGASAVGCWVKVNYTLPTLNKDQKELQLTEVFDMDTIAAVEAAGALGEGAVSTEESEVLPMPEIEQVEEIPEMVDLPELAPLPDIPDLPAPSEPKASALTVDRPEPKAAASSSKTGRGGRGGSPDGLPGGTAEGGRGTAEAWAHRLSRGHTPKPRYPEVCRRKNQEGRVLVTFTVDEDGNVVNARVSKSAPYPEMNRAALEAIYRWKLPAGVRGTTSKSIVFKLK